jgi:hypothetical protein
VPIYLVRAFDSEEMQVFVRQVYVKKREELLDKAIYDENKDRPYEDRLCKSHLHFSTRLLVEKVPELGDN